MRSLFYKLKRNKAMLTFLICLSLLTLLTLSCVIFDIVELAATSQNSTSFSSAFVPFNIVVAALDGIFLVIFVIYIIVKKRAK